MNTSRPKEYTEMQTAATSNISRTYKAVSIIQCLILFNFREKGLNVNMYTKYIVCVMRSRQHRAILFSIATEKIISKYVLR